MPCIEIDPGLLIRLADMDPFHAGLRSSAENNPSLMPWAAWFAVSHFKCSMSPCRDSSVAVACIGKIPPGCSVVCCPSDQPHYPNLPVILFPRNAGDVQALATVYGRLAGYKIEPGKDSSENPNFASRSLAFCIA
jgi:hypothetical protein